MEEQKSEGLTWALWQGEPRTAGTGEILCEPYVPSLGTKRISCNQPLLFTYNNISSFPHTVQHPAPIKEVHDVFYECTRTFLKRAPSCRFHAHWNMKIFKAQIERSRWISQNVLLMNTTSLKCKTSCSGQWKTVRSVSVLTKWSLRPPQGYLLALQYPHHLTHPPPGDKQTLIM